MLSNTATPKYYGKFRDAVMRGEIPVNEKVSMQMNRIDALIASKAFYYDDKAVEGFIEFCENEMTLTDGSDVKMLETFKLWAEDLLSWFYYDERSYYVPGKKGSKGKYVTKKVKKRLCNEQYLIIARSGAKTLYDTFIQAYFLLCDTSSTDQITTSPTMRQSEEVLIPFKTAIARAKGPLFQFFTSGNINNTAGSKAKRVKLASTKKGVENFLTNSILRIIPMTIDKIQGLRCKIATVDEWLSGDIREDVMGPIAQGCAKNEDYVLLATSSEGTVRNGPGDTIKMELMKILKGESINPHVSIWWYGLDDIKEVANPRLWLKAQPNLGQTVTWETYQLEVEKMERNPFSRNDILAKRFGIPMEGYTYFFTYDETLPHRHREFWQLPCSLGADMSQGDDFCAFTFMFPVGKDTFGIKTRSYITERTLLRLPLALREKYNQFLNEGSLIVMEGSILNMMDVYDDLDRFIEKNEYDVRTFGYDPYNASEFVKRWITENGQYGVEKVIQGSRTESVPLGELKMMAEDRKLLFDEELMSFCMGNCITLEDTNGNRKLYKKRQDRKIDNVAAMMDAYVAFKLNTDAFE